MVFARYRAVCDWLTTREWTTTPAPLWQTSRPDRNREGKDAGPCRRAVLSAGACGIGSVASGPLGALGFDVHAVERRGSRHEETVLLRPAEAEVGAALRQVDLAEQRPVRAVAVHAVEPGATGRGRRPQVAVPVGADPIGPAWPGELHERAAIDRSDPVDVEDADLADVDHVQPCLVGCEADPVGAVHSGDHRCPVAVPHPVDVAGQLLGRAVALEVALDPPAGIGEP